MSQTYNSDLITPAGIEAILEFLPYFENQTSFGEPARINDSGSTYWASLSEESSKFLRTLYHYNFVQPFDWKSWISEHHALAYHEEGQDKLALEGIGKLLTSIVRGDRFTDGLLLGAMDSGRILRILYRLKEIS